MCKPTDGLHPKTVWRGLSILCTSESVCMHVSVCVFVNSCPWPDLMDILIYTCTHANTSSRACMGPGSGIGIHWAVRIDNGGQYVSWDHWMDPRLRGRWDLKGDREMEALRERAAAAQRSVRHLMERQQGSSKQCRACCSQRNTGGTQTYRQGGKSSSHTLCSALKEHV